MAKMLRKRPVAPEGRASRRPTLNGAGRIALIGGCAVLTAAAGLTVEPRRVQAVECANAGAQTTPPNDDGDASSTACGDAASATGAFGTALGNIAIASGIASTALGRGASATGSLSTAVGADARATGDSSIAIGRGASPASASGDGAIAIGASAQAAGNSATAIGESASAAFTNSAAVGNGAVATRANQQMFGTTSNTYTMAGITSAASAAAQSGARQIVTSDSAGNLATSTLAGLGVASSTDIGALQSQIDGLVQRDRQLATGIAISLALAQPMLQAGQTVGVRVGWGNFGGSNAVGLSAAGVLARGFAGPTTSLVVDAGIGFGSSQAGGRAGVTFGW